MEYILSTAVVWILFALAVPFRKWREYYTLLIFTALLGTVSDIGGVVFNQWRYYGPTVGGVSLWSNLGIAPPVAGLFIRLYPSSEKTLIQGVYLGAWALLNTLLEGFFVLAGWIIYHQWNSWRAFVFYVAFFGLIGLQEYWYNGTGKLRDG